MISEAEIQRELERARAMPAGEAVAVVGQDPPGSGDGGTP
jgi:hypothetical protein